MVHNSRQTNLRGFANPMASVTYVTSAPYHPSTNGAIEQAVQTMKKSLLMNQELYRLNCQDF